MNPRDFLEAANELLNSDREADWRSAISRSYYASLHVALELFRRCGFQPPRDAAVHRYAIYRLSNSAHPDLEALGRKLEDLRDARNRADYDLFRPILSPAASAGTATGEDIIRLLDEALTLPQVLAQITQTMRDYERDTLREITWHA